MTESELLSHLRSQQRAQYAGALAALRHLVECADDELRNKMRLELKRFVLIPLDTALGTKTIAQSEPLVIQSAPAGVVQP